MIFGVDIIINFLLQKLDEEGKSQNLPLETVAVEYLKTEFLTDLIVILPLGGLMSLYDQRLEIFWLIKAIRIKDLYNYLNIKHF